MKKLILTSVIGLFTFISGFAQNNYEELPQTTQDFIESHFPSVAIKSAEREKDLLNFGNGELYEVELANGIKMDFNKAGNLTEIDSHNGEQIPEGVISEKISAYVSENYKNAHIVGWESKGKKEEVELSDDTELEFDINGKFLRVD